MSLQNKVLLAKLSISQWYNQVAEKKVVQDIATHYGATNRTHDRYVKRLLPVAAVQEILHCISALREYHNSKTLPWQDNSVRILPSSLFMEHAENISRLQAKFRGAVDKFIAKYPDWIAKSQAEMGELFNPAQYPTPKEIQEAYAVEVAFMPFPDTADFRVDISDSAMKSIREQAERDIAKSIDEANKHLRDRILDRMEALYVVLANPKAIFRDATVTSLFETAENVAALNVTNNEELKLLVSCINSLNSPPFNEAKFLRNTPIVRAQVAASLLKLLKDFKHVNFCPPSRDGSNSSSTG